MREKSKFLDPSPVMTEAARRMRREGTASEEILWRALRGRALGAKFRRQQPVGPFIADFYCHEAGLVIEVDGSWHQGREREDAARDEAFASLGLKVLRLESSVVETDLAVALARVLNALTSPRPLGEGQG